MFKQIFPNSIKTITLRWGSEEIEDVGIGARFKG